MTAASFPGKRKCFVNTQLQYSAGWIIRAWRMNSVTAETISYVSLPLLQVM